MAEYSRMAEGTFVSTGSSAVINLPFQPDYIEIENQTAYATGVSASTVLSAKWQAGLPQGTALIEGYSSAGSNPFVGDFISSHGISTFAAGQLLQYGPKVAISASTKGSQTNFTTSAPHGLAVGDTVIFTGLYNSPASTGMAQMSNMPFQVVDTGSTTTFTVDWNSTGSNYTNLSSPPNAFFKKVLYPSLYFPGVCFINSISVASDTINTVITTTAPHNFVVGQEVAFRIPPVWGTVQLNSLPDALIPGSPVYYYVTEIPDDLSFVIKVPFASLTAYNDNQPISSVPGLDYPQAVAAGDINSGGWPYSGGNLYPSPVSGSGFGSSTINGPAIQGAFVNNTSQGFIIGAGLGSVITGSIIDGAEQTMIYRAYLHDLVTLT